MSIHRSILFLAAVFFAITSCDFLGIGGEPSIPGKIVFSAKDSDGNYQIHAMNADGSRVRQLTHLENDGAVEPSWSPDGSRIVFTTSFRSSTAGFSLYLMDANGRNMRALHEREGSHLPTAGSNPRWSPDGSKIVWYGGIANDLFIYDFQTDSVTKLTDGPGNNTYPNWSPDGKRIVFASNRDYYDAEAMRWRTDLYVVDVDGSNLERLTETGNATRPAWNPNGETIVYEWGIGGNNVYLYELSTGQITRIDSGLQFSGNPKWNRDGTALLINGRRGAGSGPEMRLLNMETDPPEILRQIVLEDKAIGGRYDWYSN